MRYYIINNSFKSTGFVFILILLCFQPAFALDTDIYQANVKQNAYVLMDNSGSMAYGVYESSINYADMYDYLYEKSDIGDTIAGSAYYENHETRNKIYLIKGNIGVKVKTVDGELKVFTGDAADPDYLWYSNNLIDLHVFLDSDGNLVTEDGETARLTVNDDGYVLLDGVELPLGQGRLLHNVSTMFDGSTVDKGFAGLMEAPGYYFSGLEAVGNSATDHDAADDNDEYIYFFVTGNWMNMQQMYNLHYISEPTGSAAKGDAAWEYESFPIDEGSWSVVDHEVDYPDDEDDSTDYAINLSANDSVQTITHVGASKIQVHFSMFDVFGDGRSDKYNNDYVVIYDASGNEIVRYDNDNNPKDDWSQTVTGDTVKICLVSNVKTSGWGKHKTIVDDEGRGYTIDKYRISYDTDDSTSYYTMQSRLDVAKDAMLYVIDEMSGKINWGFATFNYNGTTANGATIHSALNPNDTDDANREAIANHVEGVEPMYGTPLGEALQDVFEDGYYGHRNSLDNLLCRKNYVIVVSDGFPSGDNNWTRISGQTFSDEDGDGWTADPYQYDNPPDNYYDDVASWMYNHSWLDKSLVSDPSTSYVNVISHQISFGMDHPLLEDAAADAGGEYITAYNKTQLVNAFYSLALLISQSISFTAPVVSVDATNKVENGDDLYMGLFLPMDADYWPGNLKKFKLGDGSADRPETDMIYDGGNVDAVDGDGLFVDNTTAFWADDNDENDSDNYGGPDIEEDGAGEVLTDRVQAHVTAGSNYYERNIKTYLSGSLVDFNQTNILPSDLGLSSTNTETRNKVVNWIYGYTFDADETTGAPVAAREWALGAIVHSRPTVIDYYNSSDFSQIDQRYVVVGADDGMLHVFDDGTANDDGTGKEVFAFIPPDVLASLPGYETELHQALVDGSITLYRQNKQPKYLIFGLRRGGGSYWALDVSDSDVANWSVAWVFADSELSQSWSDVEIAKIRTGDNDFTDVAIFTGGYDPLEDDYPEPFDDEDNNGSPYADGATYADGAKIDKTEWSSSDSSQDLNGNGIYDVANPTGDDHGRGIYVVKVSDGSVVFSVKYGETASPSSMGTASIVTNQTRTDFNYCFPASPSVVTVSKIYSYDDNGSTVSARSTNVLASIYAPDIYGNLFRITYDYGDGTAPTWLVKHVFSANPGSISASGKQGVGDSSLDIGRKVFYGPAVSWKGAGSYFDPSNYYYPSTTFSGQYTIASLFFGTGDREHPNYQLILDRIYAVYDDTPVSASNTVAVSSAPYTEDDLLNVTCDELGVDTSLASATTDLQTTEYKSGLYTLLTDDVLNADTTDAMELAGEGENDAKGWYVIIQKQGLSDYCSHCEYEATVDSSEGGEDYHVGEKVLSKFTLYAGTLYFTTYQPSYDDPCAPEGNAYTYSLNYLNGEAALNLNSDNDDDDTVNKDVTDRYRKYSGVKGLPSGFEIVIRNGQSMAMASVGGAIIGGGEGGDYDIPGQESGIDLYYWIER